MTGQAFPWIVGASLAMHVAAVQLTPASHGARAEQPEPAAMEWVRMTPLPPEPELEVAPEPEPEPEVREPVVRAPAPERVRPSPAAAEPPPSEEPVADAAPVELLGVTLSSGDGGWAPQGNGGEPTGPARRPRSGSGRAEAPGTPEDDDGPRLVAVGDLGRPPQPPELRRALQEAYPADERRTGRTGEALVRARIAPTGRVGQITVLASSTPGFGQACREVLRASRWGAPLDESGEPVATFVRYRCRFETR